MEAEKKQKHFVSASDSDGIVRTIDLPQWPKFLGSSQLIENRAQNDGRKLGGKTFSSPVSGTPMNPKLLQP